MPPVAVGFLKSRSLRRGLFEGEMVRKVTNGLGTFMSSSHGKKLKGGYKGGVSAGLKGNGHLRLPVGA